VTAPNLVDRQGAACECVPPEPAAENFHEQWRCACGHKYGMVQHDDSSGTWFSWQRFRTFGDPDVQELLAKRRRP
jgi:hypothetical protein